MKHEWQPLPYESSVDDMMRPPRRKCATCGKVQTRETQTWYMRVTGYRWRPLVGRCLVEG